MRLFFIALLICSCIFPFWMFVDLIGSYAHNQYASRHLLFDREANGTYSSNPEFGLTSSQISSLDKYTAAAYTDAVRDGYRLGVCCNRLSVQSLALDFLLFIASIGGIVSNRKQRKQRDGCSGQLPAPIETNLTSRAGL